MANWLFGRSTCLATPEKKNRDVLSLSDQPEKIIRESDRIKTHDAPPTPSILLVVRVWDHHNETCISYTKFGTISNDGYVITFLDQTTTKRASLQPRHISFSWKIRGIKIIFLQLPGISVAVTRRISSPHLMIKPQGSGFQRKMQSHNISKHSRTKEARIISNLERYSVAPGLTSKSELPFMDPAAASPPRPSSR
jgi:hypothetical protein